MEKNVCFKTIRNFDARIKFWKQAHSWLRNHNLGNWKKETEVAYVSIILSLINKGLTRELGGLSRQSPNNLMKDGKNKGQDHPFSFLPLSIPLSICRHMSNLPTNTVGEYGTPPLHPGYAPVHNLTDCQLNINWCKQTLILNLIDWKLCFEGYMEY